MKGLTIVAPALAASSACVGEKHSVTLVRMPRAESAFVAFSPSGISGTLTTTLGWMPASRSPSSTMPSASSAVTSALIGPSTMEQISSITSSNTRPERAMRDGFVVTPSITPHEA